MKKQLPIMKFLFSLIVLQAGFSTQAQDTNITFNRIKARINARNPMFHNPKTHRAAFEVPAGSWINSIYAANWWLAADGPDNTKVVACDTYGGNAHDFVCGPVANVYDSAYTKRWEKVWVVSRTEIQSHLANYQTWGYITPASIAEWPAHGDTTNGEPWLVAPFFDADHDGKYIPMNGDYPAIRGDVAAFVVRNDMGAPKTSTGSAPMNIQLSMLFYGYNNSSEVLGNTLFLHTELVNTGSQSLTGLKMGMWANFELGNPYDNYIGTDSLNQAIYMYNADNNDEDWSEKGYGTTPPVQAFAFLNTNLVNSVDYRLSGQGSFYHEQPSTPLHYYYYLHNRYKDGRDFPSEFVYGGNPDGSSGECEGSSNNMSGMRFIVGIADRGDLAPGQSVCTDGAFVWSRADNGNNLTSVAEMKNNLVSVKTFYQAQTANACDFESGVHEFQQDLHFNIYPNPAKHEFMVQIDAGQDLNSVGLYNSIGQLVFQGKEPKVKVESLPSGLYVVRIITSKGTASQSVVVE